MIHRMLLLVSDVIGATATATAAIGMLLLLVVVLLTLRSCLRLGSSNSGLFTSPIMSFPGRGDSSPLPWTVVACGACIAAGTSASSGRCRCFLGASEQRVPQRRAKVRRIVQPACGATHLGQFVGVQQPALNGRRIEQV